MKDVKFIELQDIDGAQEGEILRVFENAIFPIPFERIFTVTAHSGAIRGRHAHRKCTQILSCISGAINLHVDDGSSRKNISLSPKTKAVLIPPGIWAEQQYTKDNSVLLVLCDRSYEESDYIRTYEEFIEWNDKI